jgi:hypothetical protein
MEKVSTIILNADIEQLATRQLEPGQPLLQFQPPDSHITVLLRKLYTNLMPVSPVDAEIRTKEEQDILLEASNNPNIDRERNVVNETFVCH